MNAEEEIDDTNYFDYMEKLQADKLKLTRLKRHVRFQESKKTLGTIRSMRNTILSNNRSIQNTCEFVKRNETDLVNTVVAQKEADFIRLDFKEHQNLKDSLGAIQRIFEKNSGILLDDVNVSDRPIRQYITRKKIQCNNFKILHNNCLSIVSNIEDLITSMEDNKENKGTIEVISSSKQRKRSSMLSESTFMNTFQSTNLSASSPINQIKTRESE